MKSPFLDPLCSCWFIWKMKNYWGPICTIDEQSVEHIVKLQVLQYMYMVIDNIRKYRISVILFPGTRDGFILKVEKYSWGFHYWKLQHDWASCTLLYVATQIKAWQSRYLQLRLDIFIFISMWKDWKFRPKKALTMIKWVNLPHLS